MAFAYHALIRLVWPPLLFLCCVVTGAQAAGAPVKVDCGAQPRHGTRDVGLRRVWERPAETADYLCGRLADARRDAHGNILLVDNQLKDLKVFAPDGAWLRTIGREGEGPGECSDARKVFLRPGGDMGLLQAVPGAIVWFQVDGTPAGRVRIGGDPTVNVALTAAAWAFQMGDEIFVWTDQLRSGDEYSDPAKRVVRLAPDGALGATIYAPPAEPEQATDELPEEGYQVWAGRWCPGAGGGIWVAPERDRYVLQLWQDGVLRREVRRDYEPVKRDEAGRELVRENMRSAGWREDSYRVAATAPVVASLRPAADGNLWVRLDRGGQLPPDHPLAIFDVFSPAGEWLEQIRWHVAPPLGRWLILDDRSLVMMREDGEGAVAALVLFEADR
ncbi:MAG: hypothetical protein IPK64_15385 [bacterium]|nr:hypothetical protein [bacterium]